MRNAEGGVRRSGEGGRVLLSVDLRHGENSPREPMQRAAQAVKRTRPAIIK